MFCGHHCSQIILLKMCSIIRSAPCAPTFSNFLITPSVNNTGVITFNPPLKLEAGTTYNIHNFYNQGWCSRPDQIAGPSLLEDTKWNSWTEDPVSKITDQTRKTKNGAIVAGDYYVEYAYGNKVQDPLIAPSGEYSIGDAEAEPQDLFTILKDNAGTGRDSNSQTVAGFKHASQVPEEIFYFKFKMYMCRFKFFANTTDPAIAETCYNLLFVPISTGTSTSGSTLNYFYKLISSIPTKPTDEGQDLTNADTYQSQFGSGSKTKAISDTTWDAQNPASDTVMIRMTSSINKYDQTEFSSSAGTSEEMLTSSCTLSTDKTHALLPLVSPQFKLGGQLVMANLKNYDVVYRIGVRGWIVSVAGVTTPALSQISVYNVGPDCPTGGMGSVPNSKFENTCALEKLTPVSGTTSSATGQPGVTLQAVSAINFWLRSTDRSGNEIPHEVLQSLPSNLTGYGDYQVNYPYIPTSSKYDLSFVFDDNNKILGSVINDLLLIGQSRISFDEGATFSSWLPITERNAYLDPVNFLGSGVQPKFPGNNYTFNSVLNQVPQCNGSATNASNFNSMIEISFPIVG